MTDNIIPFPSRKQMHYSKRSSENLLEFETIDKWRKGLLSKKIDQQWKTYEQMTHLDHPDIAQLIEEFLVSAPGDAMLKTKFLQELKIIYPLTVTFQVKKGTQMESVTLEDVPTEEAQWPAELLEPYEWLQDKAYADPSIVHMAKELWIYFLEKQFPIMPEIGASLKWTAALHFYTLKVVNEGLAEKKLIGELTQIYHMDADEIVEQSNFFESLLLQP